MQCYRCCRACVLSLADAVFLASNGSRSQLAPLLPVGTRIAAFLQWTGWPPLTGTDPQLVPHPADPKHCFKWDTSQCHEKNFSSASASHNLVFCPSRAPVKKVYGLIHAALQWELAQAKVPKQAGRCLACTDQVPAVQNNPL